MVLHMLEWFYNQTKLHTLLNQLANFFIMIRWRPHSISPHDCSNQLSLFVLSQNIYFKEIVLATSALTSDVVAGLCLRNELQSGTKAWQLEVLQPPDSIHWTRERLLKESTILFCCEAFFLNSFARSLLQLRGSQRLQNRREGECLSCRGSQLAICYCILHFGY